MNGKVKGKYQVHNDLPTVGLSLLLKLAMENMGTVEQEEMRGRHAENVASMHPSGRTAVFEQMVGHTQVSTRFQVWQDKVLLQTG